MDHSTTPTPTPDRRQKVIIQRVSLAAAGSLLTIAVTLFVAGFGFLRWTAAIVFAAMVVTLVAVFFGFMLSGLNRRFRDPALTVPQLLASCLAISYVVFEGSQARPALSAFYLIAFMFGALTLDARRTIGVAVFYAASYAVVGWLAVELRPAENDLWRELFRFCVFSALLAWFSALGIYVGRLRRSLHDTSRLLKSALTEAEALTRTDALTGCYNRRHMNEILRIEHARAERTGNLSLCMLDIDHFKSINDEYGHAAGDDVLRHFVGALHDLVRDTDFVVRYGGEEFLVILAQTPLEGARQFAERIRQRVSGVQFEALPKGVTVRVSIGVAEHRRSDAIEAIINRADQALYRAKAEGRDRVVCAI